LSVSELYRSIQQGAPTTSVGAGMDVLLGEMGIVVLDLAACRNSSVDEF
jgi:hypothetical protein